MIQIINLFYFRMNELLREVEKLEEDGYIVMLKWDGERSSDKRTVVITKPGEDFCMRRDTDDIWKTLEDFILEIRTS